MRLSIVYLLSVFMTMSFSAGADVVLNNLYTDNMVFQRDMPIVVRGVADANEMITVSMDGDSASVATGSDGVWRALLNKRSAATGLTLKVSGSTHTVELKNVAVGDVWLCGGQSNMDLDVDYYKATYPKMFPEALYNRVNLNVRYFRCAYKATTEPLTNITPWGSGFGDKWRVGDAESNPMIAACGYFFGAALQPQINVPVGLIHSAVCGTELRVWTPREVMKDSELLKTYLLKDEVERFPYNRPSMPYNGMIAPLTDFPIKGVLWYQGEQDVYEGKFYREHYTDLFAAFVESWRKKWNEPDLPFIYVVLAGFGKDDFSTLREQQINALGRVKNVALVSAVDLGHEQNIHPPYKKDVGDRLCAAALRLVYGRKDAPADYPMMESAVVTVDNAIEVTFGKTGDGLKSKSVRLDKHKLDADRLVGFEVCGADQVYYPVNAKIVDGTKVCLECPPAVTKPVGVRYGWGSFPLCNLYNSENLPALPFRKNLE